MITKSLLLLIARLATIVLYLLTLFAGSGGKFNPEYFTVPAIMTLVFPYLVILTLICGIAWGVARKWVMCGAAAAVIIFSWGAVKMATPVGFSKKASENSCTLKIMTFNTLHLNDLKYHDSEKHRAVRFLINCGADIICLQEMNTMFKDWQTEKKPPQELLDSLKTIYPYWCAPDIYCDLKVLSKYPIKWNKSYSQNSTFQLQFATFNIDVKGNPLSVVNVHLSSFNLTSDEQNVVTDMKSVKKAKNSVSEFKQSIYSKMRSSFRNRSALTDEILGKIGDISGPMIICGDFNDVPASWAYRKFMEAGFRDAYAATSFGFRPTFNSHLFLFHIDQILYRGGLKPLNSRVLNINTSDHYPVEAEFEFATESARAE